MQRRPAFSSAFTPERLREIPSILPTDGITPEWAWADSNGQGVKVAVVDSGIEGDHPGLVGPPVASYVAIAEQPDGTLAFDTSPHADACGHGTACAGIIRGLAPECELYSVKVLGGMRTGKASVFAAGLRWAIENGMQVCNLSLGTTRREQFGVLHELADLAYFRNVVLVSSANNMPVPSFPSMYSSVISVACHDLKDPEVFYYNPDPPVEFGAPGIDLRVPWSGGQWVTTSGNSLSAPHITGIVARILAKHPGMSVFQIKTVLRALAANVARPGEALVERERGPTTDAASACEQASQNVSRFKVQG
jgi:subtilisin